MQYRRHRYNNPQTLQVSRINAIPYAVAEASDPFFPRSQTRVPDQIEHLPIVVDVPSFVRNWKREGNGLMCFSHGGVLCYTPQSIRWKSFLFFSYVWFKNDREILPATWKWRRINFHFSKKTNSRRTKHARAKFETKCKSSGNQLTSDRTHN